MPGWCGICPASAIVAMSPQGCFQAFKAQGFTQPKVPSESFALILFKDSFIVSPIERQMVPSSCRGLWLRLCKS